mgnify:CR=1 FL=1|tara:strand:+ start:456 stop:737 length:282 start_codon:yes stop_codon:yes gene_type:complete
MSENVNVRLSVDGENFNFEMTKSESLLDSALENDVDLPYSCQSGVCTACQGRLVSGTVEMEVTDGLSDEEIDEGYILCCQSFPTSDQIDVEID